MVKVRNVGAVLIVELGALKVGVSVGLIMGLIIVGLVVVVMLGLIVGDNDGVLVIVGEITVPGSVVVGVIAVGAVSAGSFPESINCG